MAINIPKEVKTQEYPSIIFGLGLLVAVFLLAVWPGFLTTEPDCPMKETKGSLNLEEDCGKEPLCFWDHKNNICRADRPHEILARTFPDPTINLEHLEKALFYRDEQGERKPVFDAFQKIPPLELSSDCPMEKTEGSLTSEEDCKEESLCFWDRRNKLCSVNLRVILPSACPMKETGGSFSEEKDCQKESLCFWHSDKDGGRCYMGKSDPFLSHFLLLY